MKIWTRLWNFGRDADLLEILRGGGVFLLIRFIGMIGAYLFAWYISRHYGPEGNGILSFVLTGAVLLSALYNLGLNTYAVKIIPQLDHQQDASGIHAFYRTALLLISGLSLVGSLILITTTSFIPSTTLSRDLFLMSILAVPLSILLFTSHVFKARKKILIFSLLQNNILQGGALILLTIPLWNYVLPAEPVYALIAVSILAATLSLIKNTSSSHTNNTAHSLRHKKILRESWPMLAGGIAFIILNLTDRLMLRFLDTLPQLGIYDIVLRLSNLTLLGILSLNAIAEPKFSELSAHGNTSSLKRVARQTTLIGIFVTTPILLLLALFPTFWLNLFGTKGSFLSGIPTLYILLIGQTVSVLCGAVLVLLNMTGHQRSVQTILISSVLLNIILNGILIPDMGIEGAAWATMISTVLWNAWGLWMVRRNLGFWMWG